MNAFDRSPFSALDLYFYAKNIINDDQNNLLFIVVYYVKYAIFPNLIPIAFIIIKQPYNHLYSLKHNDTYLFFL